MESLKADKRKMKSTIKKQLKELAGRVTGVKTRNGRNESHFGAFGKD